MSFLIESGYLVAESFSILFDYLSQPLNTFLERFASPFASFLLDLMDFIGLDAFLADFNLLTFLLGYGAPIILVILIIYFFIP